MSQFDQDPAGPFEGGIEDARKKFLEEMASYRMELATAERINADPDWHGGHKCQCGHNFGFHFLCIYPTPCSFPGCKCKEYRA